MKKLYLLLIILILLIPLHGGCAKQKPTSDMKLDVTVAIPPLKTFVEKVAGDTVSITTIIPPGNSPANYQPTPKEMVKISNSDVYFSLNMPTERANILKKIPELNKAVKVVDLQEKVFTKLPSRQINDHNHGEDEHEDEASEHVSIDPHVWLSPKRAVIIVEEIRDTLIKLDEENKDIYEENASKYIKEIKGLDELITKEFAKKTNKQFIIFHPTYGYFADDYGLTMVAIEADGKEATAKGLENIVKIAKDNYIKVVFYQEEFDSNQAEIIAKEIDGQTIRVNPLSTNYIESLKITTDKMVKNMF